MKKTIGIWLVGFCFILHGFAGAEELVARVNDSPPSYFQQDGKWVGINVDAYQALLREAGVPFVLQQYPWSRALEMMKTKPMMMSGLTPTEERKQFMHFIGPHGKEEMIFVVHKAHAEAGIKSLDDLAYLAKKTGKKIYYEQDAFYSDEFNERVEKDAQFKQYFEESASYTSMLDMVQAGRILGYLDEKTLVLYQLKIRDKPKDNIAIHPFLVSSTDIYFGVSKTVSGEIYRKLQSANEKLLANGTYRQIIKKWSE